MVRWLGSELDNIALIVINSDAKFQRVLTAISRVVRVTLRKYVLVWVVNTVLDLFDYIIF